jgi:hypothetical protein
MVRLRAGARDVSFLHRVQSGFGAHLASYPVVIVISARVKRPELEASH